MKLFKKNFIWILCLFAVSMNSCSGDALDYGSSGEDSGEISLKIDRVDEVSTKASVVDVNNFRVEILNSQEVAVKGWAKYSDVPEKVRLKAGKYTLKASYGKADVSGFGAAYYEGRTDFVIEPQQFDRVGVICKLANVKVAIVYGVNIAENNKDYYVDVKSVKGNALRFVKGETREGYVPAGNLELKIYLTDHEGVTRSYIPDPVEAKANDFVSINVDTKEHTGNVGLDITIDSETEDKKIEIDLPSFMLPKDPPTVNADGFDPAAGINMVEGMPVTAKYNIRADGAVRVCRVKVRSEQLIARGWPAEFDLANIDDETKAFLKSEGLKWFENMNGTVFGYVDFSPVCSKLVNASGVSTMSAFTVEVSDSFSQTTGEKSLFVNTEAPVFSIEPIAGYAMWPRGVDITVDVSKGNADLIALEYKTASADWVACPDIVKTVNGNKVSFITKGFTTSTAYSFRARYNNHISAVQSATTEGVLTIPNNSMETWTTRSGPQAGWPDKGPFWAHWDPWDSDAASQGWSSINNKTTRDNDPKSYVSNTGTRRAGSPHSGSYCAELRTLGWGSGTTAAGGASIIKQVDAGQLYLGSYNSSTQAPNFGVDFTVRPSGFKFWCKYSPRGTDAGIARMVVENRENGSVTVLAEEEITIPSTGDWTQMEVALNYTVRNKKATHMYISFRSGTNLSTGDLDKGTISRGSEHVGSKLYVDDIELVY